jgi:hypothetical protein
MRLMATQQVKVTFIDAQTGAALGTARLDAQQLPASFLHPTTMHLGSDDWTVRKADPPVREQFARTGELILWLERETKVAVDPRSILFSLPTINDRLPDEAHAADGSEAVLLEDDWRQIELVHADHRQAISSEIEAIRLIHEHNRRGPGFEKLHVRSAVTNPLRTPSQLAAPKPGDEPPAAGERQTADALLLRALSPVRPLRFDGHGHSRIRNGFAHDTSAGWLVYGTLADGCIEVLALHATAPISPAASSPLPAALVLVEHFAREHDLLLVDWCRCAVAEPSTRAFRTILGAADME